DHEDDWQVLLVLLEGMERKPRGPVETEFSKVEAIFPLSERGRRLLGTRLDAHVRLEQPLFEEAFAAEDERRHRELAFRGGRALLECFGLEGYTAKFDRLQNEVWQAAKLRHRESSFPLQDGSFIANLFCYDRHEARYPRSSMGFAHDLGKVVLEHSSGGTAVRDVLTKYKTEALSGRDAQEWVANLSLLQPHFREIERFTGEYSGIACVAFLEMQERLRAEPSVRNLEALSDLLRGDHERDLALALWLAGVFFDFMPFASEYYQRVGAPFVGTRPKPEPERPGAPVDASPEPDRTAVPGQVGNRPRSTLGGPKGEQLTFIAEISETKDRKRKTTERSPRKALKRA
ncbi:MAG TPA: hypothetical protein DFS52_24465, partial [Myxococcales bacterium]|nr:hypothetical protein [Myxococcales bacterium]